MSIRLPIDLSDKTTLVDQKVITVGNTGEFATIQEALDESLKWLSKTGNIIIQLQPQDHIITTEIICEHSQRINISAQNSVTPLRKAGYANNSAADLTTARALYDTRIINQGSANMFGGSAVHDLRISHVLLQGRSTDNYFFFTTDNANITLINCTLHGTKYGIYIGDAAKLNETRCTHIHQSVRCMYVWNRGFVKSTECSYLYTVTGLYSVHGSTIRLNGAEIEATGVVGYIQYQSSIYINGTTNLKGGSSYLMYVYQNSQATFAAAATGIITLSGLSGVYVYDNSSLVMTGVLGTFDLTQMTGAITARGFYNSFIRLAAGITANQCRLDAFSFGVAAGATCTFSPVISTLGNNNSYWQ